MKLDFNMIVKFFKIPNVLFFSMVFLLLVGVMSFVAGYSTMGLISLMFFFGILSRLPAVYSDAVKETEVFSTFGMLLAIAISPWWAALFVFSGMWASNVVTPWGKSEDMLYLLMDSVGMALTVLIFPFMFSLVGYQIITAMFWFYVVRAFMYIFMAFFLRRATWATSTFLTLVCIAIAVTQAYLVIYIVAKPVFAMYGIHNWSYGVLPIWQPR